MSFLSKFPGVALASVIAFASIYLNDIFAAILGFSKSPISSIIIAIIFGMALSNFFKLKEHFTPGFEFSLKRILRLGIILLGIRLSMLDVFQLASSVLPLIIACISLTLAATYFIAKKFVLDDKFSFLTAVGTSICGVTAIVAVSPVINAHKEQTSYAIANITLFGILAMLLYPSLAEMSFTSLEQIGYFLGTSIHETSQVVGAGLIYSQQYAKESVIDIATVTKLLRNSFMLLLIPLIAFVYHRQAQVGKTTISFVNIFPFFILGFLAMALLRTLGDSQINSGSSFLFLDENNWQSFIGYTKSLAEICLTIAMASIGLSTNVKKMFSLGFKPLYLGLTVSLITGVSSFLCIQLFYS